MKGAVWIAVNILRWLTVVAVIAWANPQPLHVRAMPTPAAVELWTRTIQIAPCDPWAIKLGKWAGANVCETLPSSKSRYLHQRWRHR